MYFYVFVAVVFDHSLILSFLHKLLWLLIYQLWDTAHQLALGHQSSWTKTIRNALDYIALNSYGQTQHLKFSLTYWNCSLCRLNNLEWNDIMNCTDLENHDGFHLHCFIKSLLLYKWTYWSFIGQHENITLVSYSLILQIN